MLIFLKSMIIFVLMESSTAESNNLEEANLGFPRGLVFEISTYFKGNSSDEKIQGRALLESVLKEELSPTLYYEADESVDEMFTSTIMTVADWINGDDPPTKNLDSNKLERNLIIAFSYIHKTTNSFNKARPNEWQEFGNRSNISEKVNQTMKKYIHGVVLDLNTQDSSCNLNSSEIENFEIQKNIALSVLTKTLFYNYSHFQFGIGYNAKSIGCHKIGIAARFVEFTVLTIDFKVGANLVESYTMFEKYINDVVERNEKFLTSYTFQKYGVHLRINLEAHKRIYDEQFRSYQNLLRNFVSRWESERSGPVIFNMINEFQPAMMYPIEKTLKEANDWENGESNIIPHLHELFMDDHDDWGCQMKGRLSKIASKFDSLQVNYETWMKYADWKEEVQNLTTFKKTKGCRMGNGVLKTFKAPRNIILLVTHRSGYDEPLITPEILTSLENKTELDGMTVKSIIVTPFEGSKMPESHLRMAFHIPPNFHNISLGCIYDFWDPKLLTRSVDCDNFVGTATILIWEVILDISEASADDLSYEFYAKHIQTKLSEVLENVQMFRELKPGSEVILKFSPYPPLYSRESSHSDLFCNEEKRKIHVLFEAISNWAMIHKIRIIPKPAFDYGFRTGWWSIIAQQRVMFNMVSGYEDYVARNYPKSMNFSMDPCFNWNARLTEEIDFGWGDLGQVGITLDMYTRSRDEEPFSLSVDDLRTMLMFALHTSPTVEIKPRANNVSELLADLNTITELFAETSFDELLKINKFKKGNLLLNIPPFHSIEFFASLRKLLATSNGLNSTILKMKGVHIQEKTAHAIPLSVATRLLKAEFGDTIKLGVSIRACEHLVEDSDFPVSFQWMGDLSYIICHFESVSGVSFAPTLTVSPVDRFHQFLDVHLLLKRTFQSVFPNLESVKFRERIIVDLEKETDKSKVTEEYLTHISHINNYARGYNVSLLISGFDKERALQYKILNTSDEWVKGTDLGWWGINNFSSISNSSAFVGKHSEYFGKKRWTPESVPVRNGEDELKHLGKSGPFSSLSFYIVSGIAVVVVVVSILCVFRLKRKVKFLAKQEVMDFFEGADLSSEDCTNNSSNEFQRRKYVQEFEIPRGDFHLAGCRILGSGNFGIVYESEVKGIMCAVKMPHDNCTKESFRSMLNEVKILLYIGSHPNLMEFVGCYTREIEDGLIYIATKLCQNGSLQIHLRKELGKLEASSDNSVRLDELMRFSLEIANGMEYINTQKVVHGDLSTRNVLLDENLTCKIGDFGLSRKLYEYAQYVKENQEPMPWRWLAYESLTEMEFTTKSDVWGYGVTIWEIFSCGVLPYPGLNWTADFVEDLRNGFRMSSPQFANEAIYEQMRRCWELERESRPTFKEMHEFFLSQRNLMYYSEL